MHLYKTILKVIIKQHLGSTWGYLHRTSCWFIGSTHFCVHKLTDLSTWQNEWRETGRGVGGKGISRLQLAFAISNTPSMMKGTLALIHHSIFSLVLEARHFLGSLNWVFVAFCLTWFRVVFASAFGILLPFVRLPLLLSQPLHDWSPLTFLFLMVSWPYVALRLVCACLVPPFLVIELCLRLFRKS